MVEYRKGRPEDAEAIIDLINLVFSHDHRPHDFPELLPKLYAPENFHPEYHYLALDNGRIRACIGSYPNTQIIAGHILKSRDIGAVSVHPYARREGHMRRLMDRLLMDMEAEGIHLSWLGGQRQRYQYWGYEGVGTSVNFEMNSTNMRLVFPNRQSQWTLALMEKDDPFLHKAQVLQERQPAYFKRPLFYDTLCSWQCRPYGFYDRQGSFAGYCVMPTSGGHISELILQDEAMLDEALLALTANRSGISLSVPSWQSGRIRHLQTLCEHYSISTGEQCRIMSFEQVLRASLALDATVRSLPDASFTFSITESGEILRVTWENGIGRVEKADSAFIKWTRLEAEANLFSPAVSLYGIEGLPPIFGAIFPLPLAHFSPDAV